MMANDKFSPAPDVEAIAQKLIATIPDHNHLASAKIGYLSRAGEWKKRNKIILGRARLIKGETKHLTGLDFTIVINGDIWPTLPPDAQEALVDHELCHCDSEVDKNGTQVWKLKHHDVEEFASVIKRRGLWKSDLTEFNDAVKQHYQTSLFTPAGGLAVPVAKTA